MINLKTPIVLIGFKHAGKSALGAALAKALKLDFTDMDTVIEQHYSKTHGKHISCRNIVQNHGIEYYRELEAELLKEVMSAPPGVLAVGGGTPMRKDSRVLMNQGTVVYIHAPKGRIFERIMVRGRPAIFPDGQDPYDAFIQLWNEREPIYRAMADYEVDNIGTVDEGVAKIIALLKEHQS